MRKLKQIEIIEPELMALDENGELWFGTLEATDDGRRVIDWTPVNTPKDGAGYSEPQMSRFDKWEIEANERLRDHAAAIGEAVPLATQEETDTSTTGKEAQSSSDDRVEDGEGTDPIEHTRVGNDP